MGEEYSGLKQKTREKHRDSSYISNIVEEFTEDQMGLEKGTLNEIVCSTYFCFGKLIIKVAGPESRSMDREEWIEFGNELIESLEKNKQLFYLEGLTVVNASKTSVIIEEL